MFQTTARVGALAAIVALALAACSASEPEPSPTGHDLAEHGEVALHVHNTWVKAVDSGMTAAFGDIHNESDETITITGATTEASSMVELHEVVGDTMQPKEGGFEIAAGETITLEPGGWHIMFMDVTDPIAPGDDVEITLQLSDGSKFTFTAVAKEFSGANEDYDSGEMDMDHDEHED